MNCEKNAQRNTMYYAAHGLAGTDTAGFSPSAGDYAPVTLKKTSAALSFPPPTPFFVTSRWYLSLRDRPPLRDLHSHVPVTMNSTVARETISKHSFVFVGGDDLSS